MGLADSVVTPRLDPADPVGGTLVPPHHPQGGVLGVLARFVYGEGFAVCAEIYQRGGWEALDRALAAVAATRDVMHPDFVGPAPAELPEEPAPGEGWRLADTDRVGEHVVFALISVATGKDNLGLMAGDGWVGDRLDRWETDAGDGLTVWRTRWRTAEDAADFVYAYRRAVEALRPAGGWSSEDRSHFRDTERTLTLLLEGTHVRIQWAAAG